MTSLAASVPGAPAKDSLLAQVVDEYLFACRAGQRPDMADLIDRHPEIASDLAACLASLDFLENIAEQERLLGGPSEERDQLVLRRVEGTLGDYRILGEIGRGGMGVVYEAQQISLNRRVALKVLPFAAVLDPKQLARFKNEALAAAALDHPHIVDVLGVGCERGVHYYAMRYIDGCTLADVIAEMRSAECGARSPDIADTAESALHAPHSALASTHAILTTLGITWTKSRSPEYYRTVAELIADAADALHHAHEQDVIHRDIKPSNLMLDSRGKVWITDFGLAHIESGGTLTMTGDLMGTLRYMSPEQASGSHLGIDHRSDIYSLGVTLYELLTRRPIFADDERGALLQRIARDEPAMPRKIDAALPRDLETIILKATAKSTGDRYPTAAEFAEDLRRFLEHQAPRATRTPLPVRVWKWGRRHRSLVAATALGCLVALLASGTFVWRSWSEAVAQRNAAQVMQQRTEENFKHILAFVFPRLERLRRSDQERTPEVAALRKEMLNDGVNLFLRFYNPQSKDPLVLRQTADACVHMAHLHNLIGDQEQAISRYEESLAINRRLAKDYPNDAAFTYHVARCEDGFALLLWDYGEPQRSRAHYLQSVASFRRAYAQAPDDPQGVNDFAWALVAYPDPELRNPADALALARRALELRPNSGYLNTLGLAQIRTAQWDDAVQSLQAAARLRTRYREYDFVFLALAEAGRGDYEAARKYYGQAEAIIARDRPDNGELRRFLNEASLAIATDE